MNKLMKKKFNPFHVLDNSPFPILTSFSIFSFLYSILIFIYSNNKIALSSSLLMLILVSWLWFRDINKESSYQGWHSTYVVKGLKMGMILFIISEMFFFASFFWTFFHLSISPNLEIGQVWPPVGMTFFDPMSIPLLNSIILLSSGITVTWCHHEMLNGSFSGAKEPLVITIILGMMFTNLQVFEYLAASFSISDSSFGSIFFMCTGFHGIHVLLGTIFLIISLFRFNELLNCENRMVGMECAIWYWHFVDLIWLFLYTFMYWWMS